MPSYEESEDLMNGDVKIYILKGSKTRVWQVRFKNRLPTGGHYIRKSTGLREKASAIRFALDLYSNHTARKDFGLATSKITLGEAIKHT